MPSGGYLELRFPASPRLLRTRPERIDVRLESTMRGGTDVISRSLRAHYARRR
jgi:hypothetical protein